MARKKAVHEQIVLPDPLPEGVETVLVKRKLDAASGKAEDKRSEAFSITVPERSGGGVHAWFAMMADILSDDDGPSEYGILFAADAIRTMVADVTARAINLDTIETSATHLPVAVTLNTVKLDDQFGARMVIAFNSAEAKGLNPATDPSIAFTEYQELFGDSEE